MEYKNRSEQHYAVSESGVLVYINDAHNSKENCFCPHCGCRMLKRCGNIRAWHFAHDYRYINEVEKECSYESYLHSFAKLRLKQWFEESKSIILHYKQLIGCKHAQNCIWMKSGDECFRLDEKTIDLKEYLTICKLEETIHVDGDRFRADLLWGNPSNSNNDILIEIKVTHECTQKKKESHKRIIEFEIHSEEDVENIVTTDIKESDNIRFYGFSPKSIVDEAIPPRYLLSKFIYYRTGKAFAGSECDCQTFRNRSRCALLEVTVDNSSYVQGISYGRFYNSGLVLAKNKGFNVKNCYLCNHSHYDYDEEKLTCDFNSNELHKATQALSCSKYMLNEDFYQKILNDFLQFSQNNMVDVWSRQKRSK